MPSTLAKGNGINAVAGREFTHQPAGLLHCRPPGRRFSRREVDWATHMAARIKKEPTQKGGRIRVVTQHPKPRSANLVPVSQGTGAAVDLADTTVARVEPRGQSATPLRPQQSQATQLKQATKLREAKANLTERRQS